MLPLLYFAGSAAQGQTTELHVAAAADLQPVMPALAAAYERKTGVKVVSSFGSSATLAQQLQNGDPQDVFLSADYLYPETLVASGLVDGKQPTPYARGVLVLWARRDSPAQPLSLDSLTKPAVQKVAVANDLHAPYGMAATRAIKNLGMTDKLAGKLVVGENIAQTAQFALSGNAQAGLISLTIASSQPFREAGTFVRFPATSYPPLIQCGVVLKAAKNLAAAHAFLDWLTSKEVQASLPKFGLDAAE